MEVYKYSMRFYKYSISMRFRYLLLTNQIAAFVTTVINFILIHSQDAHMHVAN